MSFQINLRVFSGKLDYAECPHLPIKLQKFLRDHKTLPDLPSALGLSRKLFSFLSELFL